MADRPGRVGFARWRSPVASGGNRYDDELSAGLQAQGLDLREYPVTGPWPCPEADDHRRLAEILTSEQDWLIDNIVASAAPAEITAAVEAGRRVTILVHYFPSDDTALSPSQRVRLATAEAEAVSVATAVVATSEWAAAQLKTRYGRDDIHVGVPGVDPAELAAGSLPSGEPPALLWLGRLTESKDPLTLIAALSQVSDAPWTALIVGPDNADPELTREVHRRIAETDLADRIEVLGELHGEALEKMWNQSDLLVHTSRYETYGMVVSEALARGIPSVVPTGTGAVEAQTGVGMTFQAGDATALAAVLRRWLQDPAQRELWRTKAVAQRGQLATWQDTARIVASGLTN